VFPSDRYFRIRECTVMREGAAADEREWTEHEVQALWFAGSFGKNFTTTDGRAVSVVQFGVWNREAGPDFAEAAVSFDGGEAQRGSIELDMEAVDWERHGHATNLDYDGVVLHVFAGRGPREFFTRTSHHRAVPQVQLDLRTIEEPPNPQPAAKPGRCVAPLRALPLEKVREVLLGAAQFRMKRKSAALARLTELHGPDESLYQALATTLGYKANKLPFTLLAQRLPLRLLRTAKDSATALLFGVAGFLDQRELAPFDSPTRAFLRGLWEQWWPRRAEFERLALPREIWKMSGQRPMNHPQRRLAALAQIVRHWPRIRALRDACLPEATAEFFDTLRDDYWEHHYAVTSKPSAKRMALVGESRVTEMLANVFFPIGIAADPARWKEFAQLLAPLANRRTETAALRLFGDAPPDAKFLRSAAIQQGLLQIYEDFCQRDASDCEQCPFPRQLAKW
jgi:diadenosine tetraphosphatase ApaH/serine/threonine PP2A family protein phosphatase